MKFSLDADNRIVPDPQGQLEIDTTTLDPDLFYVALIEDLVSPSNVRELFKFKTYEEVNSALMISGAYEEHLQMWLVEISLPRPASLSMSYTRTFNFDVEWACEDVDRNPEHLISAQMDGEELVLRFEDTEYTIPARRYCSDDDFERYIASECYVAKTDYRSAT